MCCCRGHGYHSCCCHCGCHHGHHCGCSHDCCDGGHHCTCYETGVGSFRRRYRTHAERIADLEAYLADLKAEVQAVEEHLNELRRS